jgi:hypothetical protein
MSVMVEAITGTAVGLVMLVVGLLVVVRHANGNATESTTPSAAVGEQNRDSRASGNELHQPLLIDRII